MRKGKGTRRSGFLEGREALRLALPAMAEMGLASLTNAVDTMLVGRAALEYPNGTNFFGVAEAPQER